VFGVGSPSGITVWHTARTRKKSRNVSFSPKRIHAPFSTRSSRKLNPGSIGPLGSAAPVAASVVGSGGRGLPLRFATARSISVTPAP